MKPARKNLRLALGILALLVLACEDTSNHARPTKIYIPEGYVGWLRLEYSVPDAPALPADTFGPWLYVKYPASGLLQTSSARRTNGVASAKYYYYSKDGERQVSHEIVQAGFWTSNVKFRNGAKKEFSTFFVGTAADYQKMAFEPYRRCYESNESWNCRFELNSPDDLPPVGSVTPLP